MGLFIAFYRGLWWRAPASGPLVCWSGWACAGWGLRVGGVYFSCLVGNGVLRRGGTFENIADENNNTIHSLPTQQISNYTVEAICIFACGFDKID